MKRRISLRLGFICICLCLATIASSWAQLRRPDGASFEKTAQRAEEARERGDVAGAVRLYHAGLVLKPGWQEGWWYYGSLLYDNNQYAEAVRALRRLTALNARLGGAWALLGLSEFEIRDYGRALAHLQRGRDLGYGDAASLADVADYHLAILLNAHGDCDRARWLLASLLLRGVNSENVQVGLGLSLLRVPVLPSQLDPSKDALVHDAGNTAARVARKQYEQADAGFRQLIAKYPSTHFVHYAYGAMLASRGQEEAAKEEFRAETAVTPDSALPYMEWAFVESKASNYKDALPLALKAVELSPNSFLAHYLLGNALFATGRIRRSVVQLERACRLAPESPEVRYSLGRAYAKAGNAQLARREQAMFMQLQAARQHKSESEESAAPASQTNAAEVPGASPQ